MVPLLLMVMGGRFFARGRLGAADRRGRLPRASASLPRPRAARGLPAAALRTALVQAARVAASTLLPNAAALLVLILYPTPAMALGMRQTGGIHKVQAQLRGRCTTLPLEHAYAQGYVDTANFTRVVWYRADHAAHHTPRRLPRRRCRRRRCSRRRHLRTHHRPRHRHRLTRRRRHRRHPRPIRPRQSSPSTLPPESSPGWSTGGPTAASLHAPPRPTPSVFTGPSAASAARVSIAIRQASNQR